MEKWAPRRLRPHLGTSLASAVRSCAPAGTTLGWGWDHPRAPHPPSSRRPLQRPPQPSPDENLQPRLRFVGRSPLTPRAARQGLLLPEDHLPGWSQPTSPAVTGLGSAHSGTLSSFLDTLGLLTWPGRALGCRPPAAPGAAAPGTGYLAGPPRPHAPRGPAHSTAASAQTLLRSSRYTPPAYTST